MSPRACFVFVLLWLNLSLFSASALAEPLRASVEHNDVARGWIPEARLPIGEWRKTVARRLKAGLTWNDRLLPQEGTEVKWVPVPGWLAGHWHIERARFVLDKTGEEAPEALNQEDDIFGCQQDRTGGYWEMVRSPVSNVTVVDDAYVHFIHYDQNAGIKTASQFDLESDNLEVRVAKKNGRITGVRRRHDLYSWTFSPLGAVANDRVQFLDSAMRVKESGSGTVRTRPAKVSAFQRVDITADGFNARESFKLFLHSKNLLDLIPAD